MPDPSSWRSRLIRPSRFWRKALALMSGSVLAQAMQALMLPVLARLYLPADFGLLGTFLAALAILSVVANLGFEMTLMLPDDDREARGLLTLSFRACGVTFLISALLAAAISPAWLAGIGLGGPAGWHWLLPLSVAMEGVIQPLGFMLNRHGAYRALTETRVLRALFSLVVSLAGGWLEMGFPALLAGHFAGQVAQMIWSWVCFRRLKLPESGNRPAWQVLASRYRDFLAYGVPSAWLNVASKQVIYFLFPVHFGESATGQFAKAERILNLPPGLLSMTVGRVFFEEASRVARESPEELASLTLKTARQVALLSLPLLLVLLIWGPELFGFVLGEVWTEAGHFARWMAPWLFLTMIASPLSYLIDIRRKLRPFLFYNLILFVSRTSVLWWASSFSDARTAVAAFGISGAVLVGAQVLYLLYLGTEKPT